jgi:hypothetical protein
MGYTTNYDYTRIQQFQEFMQTNYPYMNIANDHNSVPPVNNLTFDTHGISNMAITQVYRN